MMLYIHIPSYSVYYRCIIRVNVSTVSISIIFTRKLSEIIVRVAIGKRAVSVDVGNIARVIIGISIILACTVYGSVYTCYLS